MKVVRDGARQMLAAALRMGAARAVLFRASDFHAPPPIAVEAMWLAEAEAWTGSPDPP